ncbi:MAG: GNAT family N-acetyltransferase, partial [Chloroflexi bacterium]
MHISVENDADEKDVSIVRRGMGDFNEAHTGVSDRFERLQIFVRDDEGTVRGGLLGGTYWGWLYISILWL